MVSTKSPDFRTISANHFFTALVETEARLLVFTDKLETALDEHGNAKLSKVNRELQVEVVFSPQDYKALANLLTRMIHNFEEKHKTEIKPAKDKDKPMYVRFPHFSPFFHVPPVNKLTGTLYAVNFLPHDGHRPSAYAKTMDSPQFLQ